MGKDFHLGARARAFAAATMLVVGAGAAEGADIHVPASGDLQAALNAATGGDTILLDPGAAYVGNFRLPVHAGTQFVTIRSAAPDNWLPANGVRMSPSYSRYLPKITSPNSSPAIATAAGAAFWKLQFLELGANLKGYGDIITLGDGSSTQNSMARVPGNLVIDRVYIHGDRLHGQKRGIALNSGDTTIVNSYVADIKAVGQDSQAIGGWNGPGPYRIENNYLEAAGEVFLLGGDDPKIANLSPSDITFRRNTVTRPLSWRDPIVATPGGVRSNTAADGGVLAAGAYGYRVVATRMAGASLARSAATAEIAFTLPAGARVQLQWDPVSDATEYIVYVRAPGAVNAYWKTTATSFVDDGRTAGTPGTPSAGTVWQVKNLLELKHARRVQIDHNVFSNNWSQAQDGTAILFTPRNQGGTCPWCTVEDVSFEYNVVRSVGGGINILGTDDLKPSQQTHNVRIRHNLFSDLTRAWGGYAYMLWLIRGPRDVVVDHNTIISSNGLGVVNVDQPVAGFVFTNNVARHNSYGIIGAGRSPGSSTIDVFFPQSVITRNVLAGGKASLYPAGNEFPATGDFETHFVNYATGDYSLVPGTNWAHAGTDGFDLGAELMPKGEVEAMSQGNSLSVTGLRIMH